MFSRILATGLGIVVFVASGLAQPGPRSRPPAELPDVTPEALLGLVQKSGGAAFVKVARGDVALAVVERGALEPIDCSDVVVRLRQRDKKIPAATIRWVIEDGAMVRKGDRLADLDDSELQDQARTIKHSAERAKLALTQVEESLRNTQTEMDTDVRLGEINVRLAQLELKKADADREVVELKIEQARLLLERTRAQGRAKVTQAQANVLARRSALDAEFARLKEVQEQIGHCVLTAPKDGLVIFYAAPTSRFGAGSDLVAVGEPVREGQKLVRICDLKRFQLVTRVHESHISHIKAGQTAEVRIDAFPGKKLEGKVQQVATVASQADWLAADVKVYTVHIALADGHGLNLKPGMSGEARIDAGRSSDVLHVPSSAVLRSGRQLISFVKVGKELQRRPVTGGLRGEESIEIREGLKEGDEVLRDPAAVFRRLGAPQTSVAGPGARVLVRSKPVEESSQRRSFVRAYGLSYQDFDRIAALPGVAEAVPVRAFPQEVRYQARMQFVRVVATTPSFAKANGLQLAQGRFLEDDDEAALRNVVVLDAVLAGELFGSAEPLGEVVRLAGQAFVVIGVLRARDEHAPTLQRLAILPLRVCNARFGERISLREKGVRTMEAVPLHEVQVRPASAAALPQLVTALDDLLADSRPQRDWKIEIEGR